MKKKKGLSPFTTLFVIMIIVAIASWIIPGGEYKVDDQGQVLPNTYTVLEGNARQGIWELLNSPIKGLFDAIEVVTYVLMIGGFIGVVVKTEALNAYISHLVKQMKGKENLMIIILMILFSIGGTTFGMAEETIPFYAIVITVFLKAEFDTLTAVSIVLLGSGGGVLASTINPFATGIASAIAGVNLADGMLLRFIMLVCADIVTIGFTLIYANVIRKDIKKSLVYNDLEERKKEFLGTETKTVELEFTSKRKVVMVLFAITFILMITSIIPWASKFNITIFEDALKHIKAVPILGDIVGRTMYPFGDWYFNELSMFFLLMAIIIGKTYGFRENQIVGYFIEGAQHLVSVAFIIGFSRGIKILMDDAKMTATVLHFGEVCFKNMGESIFSVLTFLFYIPLSFLIPSTSGLATVSMPIMAPLGNIVGAGASTVITAYQSACGLVNLITPTSGVVMGALAIAKIGYSKWLKFTMPVVIILFVLSAVFVYISPFIK